MNECKKNTQNEPRIKNIATNNSIKVNQKCVCVFVCVGKQNTVHIPV